MVIYIGNIRHRHINWESVYNVYQKYATNLLKYLNI